MVERLKQAIEKARLQRNLDPTNIPVRADHPATDETDIWTSLQQVEVAPSVLREQRIVASDKTDPAHVVFDVLRARVARIFKQNQWKRLAISSPTKGCGKSFVALNFAYSLARSPGTRTLLLDLDFKSPSLWQKVMTRPKYGILDYLRGTASLEDVIVRATPNLALGLNATPVRDSSELLHDRRTAERLAALVQQLKPDFVLFDLPPMFVSDDVLVFLEQVDAIMIVAASGRTKADEIRECERQIDSVTHLLGIVLNKAEDVAIDVYNASYSADDPVSV